MHSSSAPSGPARNARAGSFGKTNMQENVPKFSVAQVMPVSTQQGTLTIAVSDPIEHPGIEEIRKSTGLTVLTVIATPQDIAKAIGAFYGAPGGSPGR